MHGNVRIRGLCCASNRELVLKSCVSTWPHLGEHKLQYLSVVPRTGGRSIAVWSNMSTTCNCVSQLVSVCRVRRCVYLRVVSWWLPVYLLLGCLWLASAWSRRRLFVSRLSGRPALARSGSLGSWPCGVSKARHDPLRPNGRWLTGPPL